MFCSVVAGKKLDALFPARKAVDVRWEVVQGLQTTTMLLIYNGVRSSLQCRLSPDVDVTLQQQGDPLASPRPTQRRQQEATQCTTNSTYQVPDHIFQFGSTTHQKRQQHKQASPWILPDPAGQVAPRCGSNGKEKTPSSARAQGSGPRKGGPSE